MIRNLITKKFATVSQKQKWDVVMIGAGHNGMVAVNMLAQQGLKVLVLEQKNLLGGATKTEQPFKKAPQLRHSTGAYLLGVFPPELMKKIDLNIKTIRRVPHYFLPSTDKKYIMFGSDQEQLKEQFLKYYTHQDWVANQALNEEVAQLREDIAPSWMQSPYSLEETAERFVRPSLRQVYIDLMTKPIEDYLAKFNFKTEQIAAMYAVTDGFSGLSASFGEQGPGHNFLVHNMCRIPGSDGTFTIVEGGMGQIVTELEKNALKKGVTFQKNAKVAKIDVENGSVRRIILENGETIEGQVYVCNADPFTMRDLIGQNKLSNEFNTWLDERIRPGTTMKVNLALKKLPTFKCLPENKGQHNATIHILPDQENVIQNIKNSYQQVQKGELSDFPTIEWYLHTQADPTLQDPEKNHNSAFFIQWVPYTLSNGRKWEDHSEAYTQHIFSLIERFCPDFRECLIEHQTLYPPKLAEYFGIKYGHIHHIDNSYYLDQRLPYRTEIQGLYSCSAGTHPAGSVVGCAGHNAANEILKDLGKPQL